MACRRQGRIPANSGWSWGNPARRTNDSCQTGQRSRCASAVTASQPSTLSEPAPTTSAGDRASAIIEASSATSSGDTEHGHSIWAGDPAEAYSSAGSSQSPIGTTTSAGPDASIASLYARAIAPGTSWARAGRLLQTGYSPASRSSCRPVRNGSNASWRRSCWPTTTISGARTSRALTIALIALPSPGAVWRFTNAGSPRASA